MATKALRFFRAAALPTTANSATIGDIYFIKPSSGDGQIWVCTSLNSSSIPQFIKYGDATVYTHPSVDRTDTTSTQTATHGGTIKVVDGVTTNSQGHVTAINVKTVTLPSDQNTHYTKYLQISGNGTEAVKYTQDSDKTLNIAPGNKIGETGTSGTITINHAGITAPTPAATTALTPAYGGNFTYVQALTEDGYGHVTGITTQKVTLPGLDQTVSTKTNLPPTSAAVKSYVDNAIASAIHIKGTIGSSGASITALPKSAVVGDAYVVKTAGTYGGMVCEVGDIIICTSTSTATPTWTTVQNNLDVATSDKLGTIKIGYSQSGKNYPVVLDGNSKAYVNVPWVDTHYKAAFNIQGDGTTASSFAQSATKTLNFVPGKNVTITAGTDTITIAAEDTHYTAAHTIKVGSTTVTSFAQNAAATTTFAAGTGLSVAGSSGTVTYSHGTVTTTKATSTQTASHGGTFTCIDGVTISNGHVTGYNTKTVTLPGAYSLPTASTSIKGGIKIGTSLEMSGDVCNVVWTDFGS